jgi:polysaccharide export outer membrane protein
MRKRYLRAEMSVTLVKPRSVMVNVLGGVLNPGVFTLNAAERVGRALDAANSVKRTQSDGDVQIVMKEMSVRNITVRHHDGTEEHVDLPKYLATHEGQWNPYLREGDVIVVPRRPEFLSTIAVYGQVNAPGRFEYVAGDRLSDALLLAQGTTALAIRDRAIFSRLGEDGKTISNTTVNLDDIVAGRAENIALQPGDRIIIQRKAEERADFNVDIKGEVVYPGTYPITKDRTRLTEVIAMAGGFTGNASLGTAYLLRQSVPTESQEANRILSMRGEPSNDDSIGFALASELRFRHEEVSVDFVKLFTKNDTALNVILHAEDQVIVPSKLKSVYVFGQVAAPGHISLVEGKSVDYYIQKAGGLTDHANGGSVKVIKGKTRQWISPHEATLEDGDYVWVPSEPNHPFGYYMNIASQAATVVSVMIGVGVLIVQLTK